MPPDLNVPFVGVSISHDAEFVVDRPQGSGDFVFIHFTTPVRLLDCEGEHTTRPGACILYAPPHAQWYRAAGDSFGHDWFHCEGSDMPGLAARYRIPLNRVFYPPSPDGITPIVAEIAYENASDAMYRADMNALHVTRLCIYLSRGLEQEGRLALTPYKTAMLQVFRDLRFEVHRAPEEEWTLAGMAGRAGLSVSRFAALYREFFGIAPIEDVISSRLRQACYLLTNAMLPIKDIAEQCGFGNVYYFSRLFKQRFRCTPGKYHRRGLPRPARAVRVRNY